MVIVTHQNLKLRVFLAGHIILVHLQGDENEDGNVNSQNNEHEKNMMNTQCKGKTCKYLFNLTLVNSYGSTDIQVLQDNGKPLKQLTGTIIMHGCNTALRFN